MASSTSKRVLAVRFDRDSLAGFIDPASFLQPAGIELMSPEGSLLTVPYGDLKALCFVRDFESFPGWKPNRVFAARPKTEGLWVRFHFRDDDTVDGVLPNSLLISDTFGFTIAPPDPSFQSQRVFIPRAALADAKVLGVVGTPIHQARKAKPGQLEMFDR